VRVVNFGRLTWTVYQRKIAIEYIPTQFFTHQFCVRASRCSLALHFASPSVRWLRRLLACVP